MLDDSSSRRKLTTKEGKESASWKLASRNLLAFFGPDVDIRARHSPPASASDTSGGETQLQYYGGGRGAAAAAVNEECLLACFHFGLLARKVWS